MPIIACLPIRLVVRMFLARSSQTVRIIINSLSNSQLMTMKLRPAKRFATSSWRSVTVKRSPLEKLLAWDGEASFIR